MTIKFGALTYGRRFRKLTRFHYGLLISQLFAGMEYSLRDQLAEAVARQIKKIEDSILSNSSDALAVTVNDHAYIDKLERALRRNFDYIARWEVEPHI